MHECPDCGEICHCGGDIDDIMFDQPADCEHVCDADLDLDWPDSDDVLEDPYP